MGTCEYVEGKGKGKGASNANGEVPDVHAGIVLVARYGLLDIRLDMAVVRGTRGDMVWHGLDCCIYIHHECRAELHRVTTQGVWCRRYRSSL